MKIAEKHGITREKIAGAYDGILTTAEQDRLWIDLQREVRRFPEVPSED